MKADDLLEVMTEIDDRYLAETEEFSREISEIHVKKTIRGSSQKIKRMVAVAACFCVALTGAIAINNGAFRTENALLEASPTGMQIAQQSDMKNGVAAEEEYSRKPETAMSSKNEEMDTAKDISSSIQHPMEPVRMVRIKGILYVDTNRYDDGEGRCGVMDGTIAESTDTPGAIPQKENESNFGENIKFQYGRNEYQVEIPIENHWHIFQQAEVDSEMNIIFIGVEEGELDEN